MQDESRGGEEHEMGAEGNGTGLGASKEGEARGRTWGSGEGARLAVPQNREREGGAVGEVGEGADKRAPLVGEREKGKG